MQATRLGKDAQDPVGNVKRAVKQFGSMKTAGKRRPEIRATEELL